MNKLFLLIIAFSLITFSTKAQCPPVDPTTMGGETCDDGTVNLSVSGSTGDYLWYDAAVGGSVLHHGASFTTPSISSTTNYYAVAYPTETTNDALDFDGSDDFIDVGNQTNLQITGDQTIEMWLYPTAFVSRRNPYTKAYGGEGTITQEINGTLTYFYGINGGNAHPYQGFNSVTGLTLNTWNHIAIVRNLTTNNLLWYINGVEVATVIAEFGAATAGANAVTIGSGYVSNYAGRIDEVRVWSEARSSSQVSNLMDDCLTGDEQNLELYYRMDDGAGTTLTDYSTNSYDGTLTNMDGTDWIATGTNMTCLMCESNRITATATHIAYTNVDLGGDQCTSDPTYTLDAGAGYSSYLWSTTETSQTITVNSDDTYSVTATDGGSCSSSDAVYIAFISIPTGTGGTNCGTGTVDLSASDGTGNFVWYNAAIGGSALHNGAAFTTPEIATSTDYYVASYGSYTSNDALDFDGSVGYVDVGNPAGLQITGDQTIEMWIYPRSFESRQNPYNKAYGGEGTITQELNGTLNYFYGTSGANAHPYQGFNSTTPLVLNMWTHIAIVRNLSNNTLRWYFNGVQTATVAASFGAATAGSNNVLIGDGYTNNYSGILDEVRIWSEARITSDISDNMSSCLTGNEANLELYYRMDNGSGISLTDKTTNANNGTLTNMNDSDWVSTGSNMSCILCESSRTTVTATIISFTDVDLGADKCDVVGASVILDAGAGYSSYLWNTAETTQTISVSTEDTYSVTVSDGVSCNSTDNVLVNFISDPVGVDGDGCSNSSVSLSASGGTGNYRWYDVAVGGSVLYDGSDFSTPDINVSTDYYVSSYGASTTNDVIDFNGGTGNVTVGDQTNLKITGDQTIEMWLYPRTFASRQNPIAKAYGGEGTITQELSGSLNYFYGTSGNNGGTYQGAGSTTLLTTNTWTHVAIVRDLTNMTLTWYINGVVTSTTVASYAAAVSGTLPLYIGQGYTSNYNGLIDEVRIWSTARSQSEIQSVMSKCLTGNEIGLELYYRMDNGSGTVLTDYSPNGYDGTLNNLDNNDWVSTGSDISCGICETATRQTVTASINDNPSASYEVACPGTANTTVTITPTNLTAFYDYRETGGAFAYDAVYEQGVVTFSLANANTYEIEIQAESGLCTNLISGIVTPASPSGISGSTQSGNCNSQNENGFTYIADGAGNTIIAIDDKGTDLGNISVNVYVDGGALIHNGDAYMLRHFKITTENSPGGSGADVRFYFTAGELADLVTVSGTTIGTDDDVTVIGDLGITKYNGPTEDGTFDPSDATSLVYIAQSSNGTEFSSNYIEVNLPSFSEVYLHGSSTSEPLPVKLLAFNVKKEINGGAEVTWTTASEQNNDYFEIQRSINGSDYITIKTVNGNGTTNEANEYSIVDANPINGTSYYRLKQVDYDGESETFKAVSFNTTLSTALRFKIFPNPSSENGFKLIVNDIDSLSLITISDINGRVIYMINPKNDKHHNVIEIDKHLNKGIYFITLHSNKTINTKRLLVE